MHCEIQESTFESLHKAESSTTPVQEGDRKMKAKQYCIFLYPPEELENSDDMSVMGEIFVEV